KHANPARFCRLSVFHHHDRIGAVGSGRASHNLCPLAFVDFGQLTRPRSNLAYYLQPYRSLFTGGASVRRPQGVSIPRSAAERREIAISSQLLRQHPAAAFEKRNLLCFLSNSCSEQSASCLLNQMAGLLKRNYFFA